MPKGKATKRKADEVDRSTSGTPEYTENQAKRTKVAEDTPSTPDLLAPTSRSGRQIKPKKFVDDDLIPSKAVKTFLQLTCFIPNIKLNMLLKSIEAISYHCLKST